MGSQQQDPYPVLLYVTSQQESILRDVFTENGWELILYGCKLTGSRTKVGSTLEVSAGEEKEAEVDLTEDVPREDTYRTRRTRKTPLRKSRRLSGKYKNYAEDIEDEAKVDVIVEVGTRVEEFVITKEKNKREKKSLKRKKTSKKNKSGKRLKGKGGGSGSRSGSGSGRRSRGRSADANANDGYLVVKKEVVSELDDEATDECEEIEADLGSETDSNTEDIEETEKKRSELKTKLKMKTKPTLQDTEMLTNNVLNRIGVIKEILGSLPGDECPKELGTIFSQLIQMTEILSVALAQVDPGILSDYSGEVMHYVDPKYYKNISPVVQSVMENLMEQNLEAKPQIVDGSSSDGNIINNTISSSNTISSGVYEQRTDPQHVQEAVEVVKEKYRMFAGNPRQDLYTHVCRLKHVLECLPCEDIPTEFYDMLFQYVEMSDMVLTSVKHMREVMQSQRDEAEETEELPVGKDEQTKYHEKPDLETCMYTYKNFVKPTGVSQETWEKVRQKASQNVSNQQSQNNEQEAPQKQQDLFQETTNDMLDNTFPGMEVSQTVSGAGPTDMMSANPSVQKKVKKYKKRPRMACPYCPKSFARRALCFHHIEACHPEHTVVQTCFTCHATFRSYSLLNRHKKLTGHVIREPPGPVICELCGKTLSKKAAYDVHMKSVHKELYDIECDICGKKFKSEITMKDHKSFVHNYDVAICDFCGKSFANRKKMMCHRTRHVKERSHTCDDCGKSFFTKTLLGVHKMIHTGEKPHKCPHCPYATAFKNNLPKHIKIHNLY